MNFFDVFMVQFFDKGLRKIEKSKIKKWSNLFQDYNILKYSSLKDREHNRTLSLEPLTGF